MISAITDEWLNWPCRYCGKPYSIGTCVNCTAQKVEADMTVHGTGFMQVSELGLRCLSKDEVIKPIEFPYKP